MNQKTDKKIQSRFLLVMGTFVVLAGVPAVTSFLKSPEEQSLGVQKLSSRTPASVGKAEDAVSHVLANDQFIERENSSTSLIQYDCDSKDASKEVHGNYVRLTGVPCKDFEDLEISNQSNGFSAAVIFTKGNKFTTDFIDLAEGENNLEIIATRNDGSKFSQIFKVIRRVPSSVKK